MAIDDTSPIDFFSLLPDELVLLIISYIPPTSPQIQYISRSCQRCNLLAADPVLWMDHLESNFPHLKSSIFCVKNYIDNVSPEDLNRLVEFYNLNNKWEEWKTNLNDTKSMQIHQRESKRFFSYLHRVLRNSRKFSSFMKLGIKIKDISILRWCMTMSAFRRYCWLGCGPIDVEEMDEVSKALPDEFPSIPISDGRDIHIPICSEYISIHSSVHICRQDFSFENVGKCSKTVVKGVSMHGISNNTVVRCLSSLRPGTLTDLKLSHCSRFSPHGLPFPSTWIENRHMKSLERLKIFEYNASIADLELVSTFTQLRELHIECCETPEIASSIGCLVNLRTLIVHGCHNIDHLPESIGDLSNLNELFISHCSRLERLPDTIWNLKELIRLRICACFNLRHFPESFGSRSLRRLRELDLRNCYHLENLPESIGLLRNLNELYVRNCSTMDQLPESIGSLSELREVDLSYCSGLLKLPESLKSLVNLRMLRLRGCNKIKNLVEAIECKGIEILVVKY